MYLDITGLFKEEARNLILLHEQIYLNIIISNDEPNTYNILPIAGSQLGAIHSEELKTKMKGENNSMFGIKVKVTQEVNSISLFI